MANRWGKSGNNDRLYLFIYLDSQITAHGNCSHEVKRCKRCLLPGRKVMTNLLLLLMLLSRFSCVRICATLWTTAHQTPLSTGFSTQEYWSGLPFISPHDQPRQHIKNRDITLPTKVRLVKAMVSPVVMYGCESWTIKKTEHWRIDAFELRCWRRLLRVPWTARRFN